MRMLLKRLRFSAGLVAAVLGGAALAVPAPASAATGPFAGHTFRIFDDGLEDPATGSIGLTFQNPDGMYVGWARIRLKEPHTGNVFREITTGDLVTGQPAKNFGYDLAPGTGISIDFFAVSWNGTIAHTQELSIPANSTNCFFFRGQLTSDDPPRVTHCSSNKPL
jgi:hypothetical protein